VKNGRTTLARVVGLPSIPQPLEDSLAVPDSVAPEPDLEQVALDHRRDLAAARSAIEAARHGVDSAMSQYYPSVTLDVNAFLFRQSYADASHWNALLSANLPIFTAGRIEAEVRIAWSFLRQAELALSGARFDRSVFYLDLRRAIGDLPAREDPALTAR